MIIQTLLSRLDDDTKSKRLELFKSWEELGYSLSFYPYGDCYVMMAEIPDKDFEKLLNIFSNKDEAAGAFLDMALEYGWEPVPKNYLVYHAHFEGDILKAGILTEDGSFQPYDQLNLENMIRELARYDRIVVYSYDVITYIKDVYPDVDRKVYVIAKEIAKAKGKAPYLEELAQMYGTEVKSLEEKLSFIKGLLDGPIKLDGEFTLPPVNKPLLEC